MSIGDTDKTWWEYIGNHLKNNNKRLIIFWWDDENISSKFSDSRLNKADNIRDKFLSQTTLNEAQKEDIKNKIYVSYKEEKIFNSPIIDKLPKPSSAIQN